jgi:UDP-N-acetylglucosamine/UDP-N-acetylgalactosamine diphosphorylase
MNPSKSLESVRSTLAKHDQRHLLKHWDRLNDSQRDELLSDLERIDFDAISDLIETHVKTEQPHEIPKQIEPAPFLPAKPDAKYRARYAKGRERGISLIRQNQVAAFTVAGGQGTRLGFDGPKGAYGISPVRDKPLFQLFAEFILSTNRRYGADLVWYIMTSPQNDAETRAFFESNHHFGMAADKVRLFQQGVMPAFSTDGKIILDQPHRIAFSPDGHGGSLLALKRSGVLAEMAQAGVRQISYFQVDNPLVKPIDPLFIGLHDMAGSQMGSKTIPKADDLEKVGNFVVADGKTQVIEYSDFPDHLAHSRDEQGHRRFDAGSIAIHVLDRTFVEKLTADDKHFALPWHRAVKKVPFVNEAGERVEPDKPNAVKLESFIFDALPLANQPLILQTSRAEEFSPVKNATGVDSAETSRRDMNRRAAAWLQKAGADVPRTAEGEPDGWFEISPLFALDAEHLCQVMSKPPAITTGGEHYWE